MPIFAAVLTRTDTGWYGAEVDLGGTDDIDDIVELMRDTAGDGTGRLADGTDPEDGTTVLLVEAEDEWFGIVRVDGHNDPRVFLSDARVVPGAPIAAVLAQGGGMEVEEPGEREGTGRPPLLKPGGDAELLADIGTSGTELLALTLSEGVLPSEALAAVAERAGFANTLEALRG